MEKVRTPLNTVVMGLKLLQEEVNHLVYGSDGSSRSVESKAAGEANGGPVMDLSNQILGSAENAGTEVFSLYQS